MTPSGGSSTRLRWRRHEGPARIYYAEGTSFDIVWDPAGRAEGESGGWYAWQGSVCLGIFPTLAEAKAFIEAEARLVAQ
jgi:hypothetical protein